MAHPPALLGYYDVRDFGSLSLTTDNAPLMQMAMDQAYADSQTGIFFPPSPSAFPLSQLRIKKGMSILGGGFQQTRLVQPPGVNCSMLVNDPVTLPPTEFMHWSQIAHLCVRQQVQGGNTVGCGIEIACRTGEAFRIECVNTIGMPESGIRFLRGGQPCYLVDVHGFGNGQYALDLQRTGQDIWQMVQCTVISGDNNGLGLVRIKTAGALCETFAFLGVKSETSLPRRQANIFTLDNLNGCPVHIQNLSAIIGAQGNPNAFVQILTSSARVRLTGAYAPLQWPFALDDRIRKETVAYSRARLELAWSTHAGITHQILS